MLLASPAAAAGPGATPENLFPGIGLWMHLTGNENPAEAGKFLPKVS